MTAGEMREQRIRLRLELEEAEERLNQLREEAIRQADLFLSLAHGCATHQRDIFIAIRLASYMAYRLSR